MKVVFDCWYEDINHVIQQDDRLDPYNYIVGKAAKHGDVDEEKVNITKALLYDDGTMIREGDNVMVEGKRFLIFNIDSDGCMDLVPND